MKTNFFEQIAGLQNKGSLLLNIQSAENGMIAVSAVVRRGNEHSSLPPMLLSGSPQELDEVSLKPLQHQYKRQADY